MLFFLFTNIILSSLLILTYCCSRLIATRVILVKILALISATLSAFQFLSFNINIDRQTSPPIQRYLTIFLPTELPCVYRKRVLSKLTVSVHQEVNQQIYPVFHSDSKGAVPPEHRNCCSPTRSARSCVTAVQLRSPHSRRESAT